MPDAPVRRPTCPGRANTADPTAAAHGDIDAQLVCDLPAGHYRSRCQTLWGTLFDPDVEIDQKAINAAIETGTYDPEAGRANAAAEQHAAEVADVPEAGSEAGRPEAGPEHTADSSSCPACAAAEAGADETDTLAPPLGDNRVQRRSFLPTRLSPELTDGLTHWGRDFGAQMRGESEWLRDDAGQLVYPDGADPATSLPLADPEEVTALYLAIHDTAYQSSEDGKPWRFCADDARALRDLLNIATARGAL